MHTYTHTPKAAAHAYATLDWLLPAAPTGSLMANGGDEDDDPPPEKTDDDRGGKLSTLR